jgi:hypothetical protein
MSQNFFLMNSLATMLLGPAVYSGKHTERSWHKAERSVSDYHTSLSTCGTGTVLWGTVAHLLLDHFLEQVLLVQEEKERSCCKNWIAGKHKTQRAHTDWQHSCQIGRLAVATCQSFHTKLAGWTLPHDRCKQLQAVVQPVAALVLEHDLVVFDERYHEDNGLSGHTDDGWTATWVVRRPFAVPRGVTIAY